MVIITTLGRCGSSILTKYLYELGFKLGKDIYWDSEMRAGLELSTVYTLNRSMYRRYLDYKQGTFHRTLNVDHKCTEEYWEGHTWREAILKVDKDPKQGGKIDVIKDPRFMWHPQIIEAWWDVRKDFSMIICHRKIEDIYKSRKAMSPRHDDHQRKRFGIDRYKTDFVDFYGAVLDLGIKHRVLYFPNYLFDFKTMWESLQEVGLEHSFEKGKKIWEDIVEFDRYKSIGMRMKQREENKNEIK
jgi:hypothetical protein